MDFISYLKTLKPADWDKPATSKWTVKDVVAHMVGWEKGDPEAIRKAWATKQPSWWLETSDYEEFNRKNVEFYREYTPAELIQEWEKWREYNQKEIDRIGEAKLRARPDLFGWLFEEEKAGSHYDHHYQQVRATVEGK